MKDLESSFSLELARVVTHYRRENAARVKQIIELDRELSADTTEPFNDEARQQRAERRQAIVLPILERKGWTPGKLVTAAGIGKKPVYRYLDGTRATITARNRAAIADVLEIKPENLPD